MALRQQEQALANSAISWQPEVDGMSITSEADWAGLREAGRVTSRALDLLESLVRPGVTTGQLDEAAERFVRAEGARSAPALEYGFPRTVLISVNDEVVHGIPGSRVLVDGDVVSLDVTLEKDGYVADAARSVIVGAGAELARDLVACASASLAAALNVVRSGVPVNHIGRVVSQEVRRRGFGVVQGLAGHGVITIEPMVSAGATRVVQDADGWTLRTRDGSLAAHVEHTLVVTAAGPVILAA
jgi:methionyl aminopeptidase